MIKDRDQKQKALRLSVANRWFPQLEVEVVPGRELSRQIILVTDLDVLSSIPDEFKGFRSVIFDCKTKAKESPVNRALWLRGILDHVKSDQGFCILKKNSIELDHCLMAGRQNVILIAEDQFDVYARATSQNYDEHLGNISKLEVWDQLFGIPVRYPKIEQGVKFIRSTYWMTEDPGEACRKSITLLKKLAPEFDPGKLEHIAVFFEFCSLFAHSLAIVINRIFRLYLHPRTETELSVALLMMLFGGRESYRYRNELFKYIRSEKHLQNSPDLSLPEWDGFLRLARQLLDAPMEVQRVPLILREVGFSVLQDDRIFSFAKTLCSETLQGAKFAMLIASYISKAAKLPPEFGQISDHILLSLMSVK